MYFASAVIILAGLLSSLASAVSFDDGMYHPDQSPTTTTATTATTTKATTYVSVVPEISKTSEVSTWYPTSSKSTYVGYWSQNTTAATSSYKSSSSSSTTTSYPLSSMSKNTTVTTKPGNYSNTVTTYTTTVCDFQSSCYTTLATATGQGKTTPVVQPTMIPFSSSERLVAGAWAALALCGVAVLL